MQWLRTLRQHYGTTGRLRAADHDDSHHPPTCRVAHTAYLEAELAAQEHRLTMMGVRPVETRLLVVGPGTRGARTRRGLPPIGLLLALWVLALATLSMATTATPAQSSPLHATSGREQVGHGLTLHEFHPAITLQCGNDGTCAPAPAPWHHPRWGHPDGSCRDTRALLLAQRCASVTWDAHGCHVRQATCLDVYTGKQVSTDDAPHALQIDHLLPVAVARARRSWTVVEFTQYFNDMDNLMVTRARTNEQKGDHMPAGWCPALPGARKLAAVRLSRVAQRYGIPLTASDRVGLDAWGRGECAAAAKILGKD